MSTRRGPASTPLPAAWAPLIEDYLQSQAGLGRSRQTIATRRAHLAQIARGVRGVPHRVTEERLLAWMGRNPQWSMEYRRGIRNTAVSFFGWAHRSGQLTSNPAAEFPQLRGFRLLHGMRFVSGSSAVCPLGVCCPSHGQSRGDEWECRRNARQQTVCVAQLLSPKSCNTSINAQS